MPTYEYACKACGERLEVVHSFSDAPLTECPACAGPLRKVFSPVGISFKGSGFYKTDSRSGAKSSSAAAAAKPSSETGSGSESKAGETKSSESASKSPSDAGSKPSSSTSSTSSAAAS